MYMYKDKSQFVAFAYAWLFFSFINSDVALNCATGNVCKKSTEVGRLKIPIPETLGSNRSIHECGQSISSDCRITTVSKGKAGAPYMLRYSISITKGTSPFMLVINVPHDLDQIWYSQALPTLVSSRCWYEPCHFNTEQRLSLHSIAHWQPGIPPPL